MVIGQRVAVPYMDQMGAANYQGHGTQNEGKRYLIAKGLQW